LVLIRAPYNRVGARDYATNGRGRHPAGRWLRKHLALRRP